MRFLLAVVMTLSFLSLSARALDLGEVINAGPCKPGDVYCGGECHSSRDRCPRPRPCDTRVHCGSCTYQGYRECRTIDCHGSTRDSWTESCSY